MRAEHIHQRHTVTSLLLTIALTLVGLHGSRASTQPDGRDRLVFQTAHKEGVALRNAEIKPSTRKAPESFAPHLICPRTHDAVRELRFGCTRIFTAPTVAGGILHLGGLRGRAPPALDHA